MPAYLILKRLILAYLNLAGLPCYDFTPVMNHKVVSVPPKVKLPTSFARRRRRGRDLQRGFADRRAKERKLDRRVDQRGRTGIRICGYAA